MIEKLKLRWQTDPLPLIMILALIVRLLAAVFSKGFAMSDDHFVIIHVAQRWVDGFSNWFDQDHPSGFSLVYTGAHYVLFVILKHIGITDPVIKMYIVRFLHALYSLLIVYYGYKIMHKLSSQKTARVAGLLLALFWVLPFMSVRNLIEMVCVPPMVVAFYLGLIGDEKGQPRYWFYAGILFGLAFAIRYQSILIPGGLGIVFIFQRQWQKFAYFTPGVLAGMIGLQGVVDWIAWGYPFAALLQYTTYNIDARYSYVVGPWYRYLLLILGIFIPPVSLALVYGYARTIKKYAILFWPVLVFFAFHSFFPNKQERFILPILPFLIILGVIGWNQFIETSGFWKKRKIWLNISWGWFWLVNMTLLIILVFTYSKKTMVEPLVYLSKKSNLNSLVIDINNESPPAFPRYYLGKTVPIIRYYKGKSEERFRAQIEKYSQGAPDYVFFYGSDNLDSRVSRIKKLLNKDLKQEVYITPSMIDDIMHKLNPRHNLNLTSYVYKVESVGD